jgi:RsiW-degrading membrane proteinase PrsW (M82 family)|tara:strand:- start:490 stop:768 length:279 start_codon:yes stop_codon:yes gene_type:complete
MEEKSVPKNKQKINKVNKEVYKEGWWTKKFGLPFKLIFIMYIIPTLLILSLYFKSNIYKKHPIMYILGLMLAMIYIVLSMLFSLYIFILVKI